LTHVILASQREVLIIKVRDVDFEMNHAIFFRRNKEDDFNEIMGVVKGREWFAKEKSLNI